jgi:hypothetical protein
VSFSYDANGNLTNDGTRTYTWDARNQLASLTAPVNGSFAYDGVGRRRAKTIGGHRFTGEIQVRVVGRSGKRRHRRACRHRLEIHGDVDVRRDGHLK